MPREEADFLDGTWTNERFDEEYLLIKQKKSKLPASQRTKVLELMPPDRRPFLEEKLRQSFISGGEWWNASKDTK